MSRPKGETELAAIGEQLKLINRHLADIADSLRGLQRILEIANATEGPIKPGIPS